MTRTTSPCDLVSDALLDPAAPRPPGMEAHLASCPTCRRLRDAHLAAHGLGRAADRTPRAIGMEDVLARVRRRRRTRVAAAAAAAAAVALVLAVRLPGEPSRTADAEDLFALAERVGGYAQREIATEDPVLLAYAPLTDWLAPPPRRSLELPSIAPSPEIGTTSGGVSP
jgi:hypothetical protein